MARHDMQWQDILHGMIFNAAMLQRITANLRTNLYHSSTTFNRLLDICKLVGFGLRYTRSGRLMLTGSVSTLPIEKLAGEL